MTGFQSSGLLIKKVSFRETFLKDFKKLPFLQDKIEKKIRDLMKNPMPRGLEFEKLKGYSNPDIYTIHVNGNYKISLEIKGDEADLRRVANHDLIDRSP